MSFYVLTVLFEVFHFFFLIEYFKVVRVPRTCWKHLEIVLFFKLKYLPKEAHKFHLALFWLASNLAETLPAYFCTVSYKNFAPKMFDERVTKEFSSTVIVVLLEYTQE